VIGVSVREVQVGDRLVRLENFSGRKGIRVLRLLEYTAKAFPGIQDEWQRYTAHYEQTHTMDIDRAYARSVYAPQPLMREEPALDNEGQPVLGPAGEPLFQRVPMQTEDGRPVMGPDPLGHLSEEDWAASGNKLRQPRSPSAAEQFMAIFPHAVEIAENEVARLLGLIAMPNSEVRERTDNGTLWDGAADAGNEMLDAPFDELVELMVAAGEAVGEQYKRRVRERLGERLAAALELIGLSSLVGRLREQSTTSTASASTTSPTSSTDSPSPTDGMSSEPSTEPAGAGSSLSSTA
jgi:hypothetical protein